MKSSIYVSAEHIQVIGYAGNTVKQFVTYPIPEGTVYNGTITDSAFLAECLTSMKRDYPDLFKSDVTLVVDGSTILSRRIVTPRLSKKQYLQLVRDDFADSIENTADLVCGYRKLQTAENSILACAVNKALVDSYISTFLSAGIKLDAIHVGVETILSFVKTKQELQKSALVINIIDGHTMLSMLFQDGSNVFMTRTRLYGEEKEQLLQNVLENLNGLIQFSRSQKLGEIAVSYYLGVNEADIRLLEAFNPYTDIRLDTLSVYESFGEIPPDAHFTCLNMMYGGDCIDLIAARRELDKFVKSKRPKKLWIPLLAIYIVVLAAVAAYLWWENSRTDKLISEVNEYIQSPAILQRQAEIDALMRETALYQDITRQVDEKATWENGMPKASSRMMDLIVFNHGVDVTVTSFEFSESTGVVRVNAACADANVSADYVDALYRSGVASSVWYQGYGSGADGVFTFTVDITLNVEGVK